jgi:two-component system LytT family response regulator
MLRILIVDDERLARVELKRLLKKFDDVEVVAEAKNANEAMDILATQVIDLAFLDIQMPEISGLELAQQMGNQTLFVFCTAFSEHALDAFSLNAADYIVKPVVPERLQQSLERVKSLLSQSDADATQPIINAYLPDSHGLLLKFGDTSRIVRLQEVERFESVGNHCAVYTSAGKSFVHAALTKVESRLDPNLFFKASRSDIIRVDNIKELQSGFSTGSLIAIMNSGCEIEVSRRQATALKQLFHVF